MEPLDELMFVSLMQGTAVGCVAAFALALWRSPVERQLHRAMLLCAGSALCWLLSELPGFALLPRPAVVVLGLLGAPVVALIWMTVLLVFEDRKPGPLHWVVTAAGALLGAAMLAPPAWAQPSMVGWNLLNGALALHMLLVVGLGWRDDLVEERRRLRRPLLFAFGLVAAALLILVALMLAQQLGWRNDWSAEAYAAVLGLAVVLSAGMMLQARPIAGGGASPPDLPAEADDAPLLAELERLMIGEEAWRREGLTIGALAQELNLGQRALRRLINRKLGHRNFPAFVNAYRIEAAKARLADPAEARRTVAEIAFDLGFASLGPFNRAFRAATGETPTEWRRRNA